MGVYRRDILRASLMGVTALGLTASAMGYAETRRVEVTRLDVGLGGKIAFLTDTHIHELGEVEEEIIQLTNREAPDIIIIGGDIVDRLTTSMKPVREYLASLEAREKLAVLGNHDYWSGLSDKVSKILKENNFKILKDTTTDSTIGKIYGVDWRDSRTYPKISFEGLIISHDPNAADYVSGSGIILAGHTHGGVVVANYPIVTNSKYTRGMYRIGENLAIYVSRGLGQMLPIRITSPLELLIIT